MDDKRDQKITIGIGIGLVIAVIFFYVIGAKPKSISTWFIEWELPTEQSETYIQDKTQLPENFSAPSVTQVKAEDILPSIEGNDSELSESLKWWNEIDQSGSDGVVTPLLKNQNSFCVGLAWNTINYGQRVLLVFTKPLEINFGQGGWYSNVCISDSTNISLYDIGLIQVDWITKRYNDNEKWEIVIIE